MDFQTEAELKVALGFLQQGNPLDAQKIISSLFEHDLESTELVYTNKCCIFWIDSIKRLKSMNDSFERSENILLEWKNFQDYISRESAPYEPAMFAVQQGFFKNALEEYKKMLDEKDPLQKAEIYKKTGICYKKKPGPEVSKGPPSGHRSAGECRSSSGPSECRERRAGLTRDRPRAHRCAHPRKSAGR